MPPPSLHVYQLDKMKANPYFTVVKDQEVFQKCTIGSKVMAIYSCWFRLMDFACCRLTERADWMMECGLGGRRGLSLNFITCFVYIHSERGLFGALYWFMKGLSQGFPIQFPSKSAFFITQLMLSRTVWFPGYLLLYLVFDKMQRGGNWVYNYLSVRLLRKFIHKY